MLWRPRQARSTDRRHAWLAGAMWWPDSCCRGARAGFSRGAVQLAVPSRKNSRRAQWLRRSPAPPPPLHTHPTPPARSDDRTHVRDGRCRADARRCHAPMQHSPLLRRWRAGTGCAWRPCTQQQQRRRQPPRRQQPQRQMAAAAAQQQQQAPEQQRDVLLLDVLDTLVRDPFFEHMPRFFNLTFQELMATKHPTAWIEFESDLIDQDELFAKFFADSRPFDGAGLVQHMVAHYEYVPGMEALLARLSAAGYELHAMSNYPVWYRLIEDKLRLSRYLSWTFVSCEGPMRGLRKPAPAAFEAVTSHLQLPAGRCIFVDDRQPNVEAAGAAGMRALRFTGADALEAELQQLGLEF